MFYIYLFTFALLPLSTALRPARYVRTAERMPDDGLVQSSLNQPLPSDETHTFLSEYITSNVMNEYRKNPDSPLQRRFHLERRGRAALISRPSRGHRHLRTQ
ncbi:hypothetical protein Y032_0489g2369 [Ancylostoma ceylanicum]|uniref:Secreted protein n=1 Tax=Ancylostoma ceylanicum TaxID=53326 RepID=A0A016WX56_9BILA|nr:hypothetical protein Y032_0489g2369 [Ancylostoma ceylanicum]